MAGRVRLSGGRAGPALWVGAALLLSLPALVTGPGAAPAIDWQPAHAWDEPWRLWSAAWVHLNARHLAGNLVGTTLVAALGWVARVPPRATLAWMLAWPLTHCALALGSPPAHYGGLSGVLHAGVVIAADGLWRGVAPDTTATARRIGLALLAGTVLKVLLEAPFSATPPWSPWLGITVAPMAHAGGVAAGWLAGRLLVRTPRRQG